jgi:hypothetical protein
VVSNQPLQFRKLVREIDDPRRAFMQASESLNFIANFGVAW